MASRPLPWVTPVPGTSWATQTGYRDWSVGFAWVSCFEDLPANECFACFASRWPVLSQVSTALGRPCLLSTRPQVRILLGALRFRSFDYVAVPAACPMALNRPLAGPVLRLSRGWPGVWITARLGFELATASSLPTYSSVPHSFPACMLYPAPGPNMLVIPEGAPTEKR